MDRKGKRRSSIFKLGRRGRRGRVPFALRWGPIPSPYSKLADEGSSPSELPINLQLRAENRASCDVKKGSAGPSNNDADYEADYTDRNPGVIIRSKLDGSGMQSCDDIPGMSTGPVEVTDNLATKRAISMSNGSRNDTTFAVRHEEEAFVNIRGSAALYAVHEDMEIREGTALPSDDNNTDDEGRQVGNDEDTDFEFEDEQLPGSISGDIQQADSGDESNGRRSPNLNSTAPDPTTMSSVMGTAGAQDEDRRVWTVSNMAPSFRKLAMWQNILSVLVVTGSARLSVQGFELFRSCMNVLLEKGFPTEQTLPAYSTITRTLLPIVRSWCFAHSEICTAEVDVSKAGARHETGTSLVVKPSTWSAMDVSCSQTWTLLKKASHEAALNTSMSWFEVIETIPTVRFRSSVLNTMGEVAPMTRHQESGQMTYPRDHEYLWSMLLRTSSKSRFPTEMLGQTMSMQENAGTSQAVMTPVRTVLVTGSVMNSDLSRVSQREITRGFLPHMRTEMRDLWEAGDYCTFLKPGVECQYVFVFVHHQARPGRLSRLMELTSIPYHVRRTVEGDYCALQWRQYHKLSVSSVKVMGRNNSSPRRSIQLDEAGCAAVPAYGKLRNGLKYFVDRILLYSDGFSQYRFKQGSAGGVYCVSLNYPPHLRRCRERVRVLALTPPGVPTSEGLRAIISDLVKSSIEGVMVRNADDEEMLLLTDAVGYVCDYCEVGHVLDVVGHNGRAPCHLCSFMRFNGHESTSSQYSNTTTTHAGNACYARSGPRTEAIRDSEVSDKDLVSMGLKTRTHAEEQRSPLFEYYKLLTERMKTAAIPLTEFNRPVVTPRFDPYRSVLVAPDHLLAGIAINELSLVFKAFPTHNRRMQADMMICQQLSLNGLLQQSSIFKCSTSTMYTTSISGTFCILLVAVPVFTEVVNDISSPDEMDHVELQTVKRIVQNLGKFRYLVSRTYWFPRRQIDHPESVAAFDRDEGKEYIRSLQQLCSEYMTECNEICKLSPLGTKELDKPNVHRLLELYNHSIPAMGHVHHFAELLFECAHQPLKRAMADSNNQDTHLQSMSHALADDWKARLDACFGAVDGVAAEGIASVLNVLCGGQEEVRKIAWEEQGFKERARSLLQNQLIRKMVGSIPQHLDCRPLNSIWRLTEPSDKLTKSIGGLRIQAHVVELVAQFLIGTDPTRVKMFEKARRLKVWGIGENETTSHSRGHDTLMRGNVVQALASDDSWGVVTLSPSTSVEDPTEHSICYYAIEAFIQDSGGINYAAVKRCVADQNGFLTMEEWTTSKLLRLSDSIRRICVVHACHGDPVLRCIRRNEPSVNCTASILKGGKYYFFNREHGYPPRMA